MAPLGMRLPSFGINGKSYWSPGQESKHVFATFCKEMVYFCILCLQILAENDCSHFAWQPTWPSYRFFKGPVAMLVFWHHQYSFKSRRCSPQRWPLRECFIHIHVRHDSYIGSSDCTFEAFVSSALLILRYKLQGKIEHKSKGERSRKKALR